MTLLKDLIDISEQMRRDDFVLKWNAAIPPDHEQSNKTITLAGDAVSGDITRGDWQCIATPLSPVNYAARYKSFASLPDEPTTNDPRKVIHSQSIPASAHDRVTRPLPESVRPPLKPKLTHAPCTDA